MSDCADQHLHNSRTSKDDMKSQFYVNLWTAQLLICLCFALGHTLSAIPCYLLQLTANTSNIFQGIMLEEYPISCWDLSTDCKVK